MSTLVLSTQATEAPSSGPPPIVHLIDDDRLLCDSVASLVERQGCRPCIHDSAEAFLGAFRIDQPQVLVVDLRLPGLTGLELLQRLARDSMLPPSLVLSGSTRLDGVVEAMRLGAMDYVEKPPEPARFLEKVDRLLAQAEPTAHERQVLKKLFRSLARLTPREREVFRLLGQGLSTKQVAHEIGISVRTAHIHRTNVMVKFGTESLVELACYAHQIGTAERRRTEAN